MLLITFLAIKSTSPICFSVFGATLRLTVSMAKSLLAAMGLFRSKLNLFVFPQTGTVRKVLNINTKPICDLLVTSHQCTLCSLVKHKLITTFFAESGSLSSLHLFFKQFNVLCIFPHSYFNSTNFFLKNIPEQ